MDGVMNYKTFFEQNIILGDPKKYSRFAYIKRYPEEYMVERDSMVGHDKDSKKVTLIFRFNGNVLISIETVYNDINSIISSESFNFRKPDFVFIQTIH